VFCGKGYLTPKTQNCIESADTQKIVL
jgi:hypothetical protein